MPSIRVLYDVEGWSFHNRALALQKYAPSDCEVSTAAFLRNADLDAALGDSAPDILFLLRLTSVDIVRNALRQRGWSTKLVVIWNSGWPRRFEHLWRVHGLADLLVFNNRIFWENSGCPSRSMVILNGVDLEVFNVKVPLDTRRPKVLWTGSEINRRLKGYDDYILPLRDRLARKGIDCDVRLVDSYGKEKMSRSDVADWYNTGTVLVCASQTEGTPNTALEAAACGCTIVSTPVGNMPELIRNGENGYLVPRRVIGLQNGVEAACKNYQALAGELQKDIRNWNWSDRCGEFYEAFRDLLRPSSSRRAAAAEPLADLTDQVTVFVATIGAPSYEACMTCLRLQDCEFRLEVIENVAPMSAAFQRMLDRCTTPYYVQVDEDMLLYPHAVRTLHEAMQQQDPSVAIYTAMLHDVHLGEHVQGVKIFRHEIVQKYPFSDVQGCEVDQIRRFQRDGYAYVLRDADRTKGPFTETLGLHGTHWTPLLIYLRYATTEQRRRRRTASGEWISGLPVMLAEKFRQDPSELNYYALLGAIKGALSSVSGAGQEKDFRSYDTDPAFRIASQLLQEITSELGSQ